MSARMTIEEQLHEARRERNEFKRKWKEAKGHLKNTEDCLRDKNIAMDALHHVWCSGGCTGGMHRWTNQELTPAIVAAAIWNTDRMVQWYINNKGRNYMYPNGFHNADCSVRENPRREGYTYEEHQDVWQRCRDEINAELRAIKEAECE